MSKQHRQHLRLAHEYQQLRKQWIDAYESYDSGAVLAGHLNRKLAEIGNRRREIEAELGEAPSEEGIK